MFSKTYHIIITMSKNTHRKASITQGVYIYIYPFVAVGCVISVHLFAIMATVSETVVNSKDGTKWCHNSFMYDFRQVLV